MSDLPPLPETPYQLYYEWPDDEDGYGGSEVVDSDGYTANQMHAYARQAIEPYEALIRQMLEALESCSSVTHWPAMQQTIAAARQRLGETVTTGYCQLDPDPAGGQP